MCAGFVDAATSQFSKAEADAAEMPDLEARCQGSKEAMELLAACSGNAEYRMNEATKVLAACKVLSATNNLAEQKAQIQIIRKSLERIGDYNDKYQSTVEAALDLQRAEAPKNLRKEFLRDPAGVVKKPTERYPQVAKLSAVQLDYIASSKYIRKQSRILNTDPEKFVRLACERAEQLPKIAAKNGSFIEIVVMYEHDNCGRAIKNALADHDIYYCAIDDFCSGNTDGFKSAVLFGLLQKNLPDILYLNGRKLVDHLYEQAWIDGSESEKKVFYDRYIKTLTLKVDQDGNFTVEVKNQK